MRFVLRYADGTYVGPDGWVVDVARAAVLTVRASGGKNDAVPLTLTTDAPPDWVQWKVRAADLTPVAVRLVVDV